MTAWSVHLAQAVQVLRQAGISDPTRDARLLLAHAAGFSADRLTLHLQDAADPIMADDFAKLIQRRAGREPVSHLIGHRLFWGRSFRITPDVLDPRPETEILVAAALEQSFHTVLDLGLGSGCILASLLADRPEARGIGVDLSAQALEVAKANVAWHGLTDRADLRLGSWYDPVSERFDLIVSNPPYIAAGEMADLSPEVRDHEPRMALTDEGDGLSAYRIIASGAVAHLLPKGCLMVEIGASQGKGVVEILGQAGLKSPEILRDFDDRDRVVRAFAP